MNKVVWYREKIIKMWSLHETKSTEFVKQIFSTENASPQNFSKTWGVIIQAQFVGTYVGAYVCVLGSKKCLFFGKFGVPCFLVTSVLRFALLPYYWRIILMPEKVEENYCIWPACRRLDFFKTHFQNMLDVSSQAVVQRCSVKEVFLKTLQNSQENTCARVFFS